MQSISKSTYRSLFASRQVIIDCDCLSVNNQNGRHLASIGLISMTIYTMGQYLQGVLRQKFKNYHRKSMMTSFSLNGHTLGFYRQTHKLKSQPVNRLSRGLGEDEKSVFRGSLRSPTYFRIFSFWPTPTNRHVHKQVNTSLFIFYKQYHRKTWENVQLGSFHLNGENFHPLTQ